MAQLVKSACTLAEDWSLAPRTHTAQLTNACNCNSRGFYRGTHTHTHARTHTYARMHMGERQRQRKRDKVK